jgi:pyridoxamine 5'-phosphate oxidase
LTNTTEPQPNFFDLPLTIQNLNSSPISQFDLWFSQAKEKGELEPSAMTLATVNKAYDVSARMLLLKSFSSDGFVFFTNYQSLKAQCLQEIPKAAMVFWWPLCQRQVRITGQIILASVKQSDDYFHQRSRDSRIAAIISKQSAVIPNRDYLLKEFDKLAKESDENLVRPEYWGGYVLQPHTIEFWQGRLHRLHDRFLYSKKDERWEIVQLSP